MAKITLLCTRCGEGINTHDAETALAWHRGHDDICPVLHPPHPVEVLKDLETKVRFDIERGRRTDPEES